jgi:hypothetical protein
MSRRFFVFVVFGERPQPLIQRSFGLQSRGAVGAFGGVSKPAIPGSHVDYAFAGQVAVGQVSDDDFEIST